jgi:hypothetical protein
MVILTCLILCLSIAIAAGLLYFSLDIHAEKIRLESDFRDLKAQIETLRYEKDVLLTKLVLAESRLKQSPLKTPPQASEAKNQPQESVVAEKTVKTVPATGIQKKPPIEKASSPASTNSRSDSGPSVAIENFKTYAQPDEKLLRVQYKIKNTSPNAQRVAGHTIVVLKGEQLRQNQWLTIPRISLSNGKPTGRQRGHSFGISNFKTMRIKTKLPKSPEIYRKASVFIFTQEGDLLLEKDFPVSLPALPPVAALKPPLKSPAVPLSVSSSRSFTGAPSISSPRPPSTSIDTSLSPSTTPPPSKDKSLNNLKNSTDQ